MLEIGLLQSVPESVEWCSILSFGEKSKNARNCTFMRFKRQLKPYMTISKSD